MILNFRLLIAVLCCSLLAGCGEKQDTADTQIEIPPDSLIAQDKMVLILADVHVIEGALLLERNKGIAVSNNQGFYYQGILKKYHISGARYDQNLAFYRQNQEDFAKMYEKVIVLIETRKKMTAGKE